MLHSIVELNFGMCKDTVVSSNDVFFFTNAFYVGSDFVFLFNVVVVYINIKNIKKYIAMT